VLADAVDVAENAERAPDAFDVAGPHVVVGPVFVEGAEPGDVLKVETLSTLLRVPYGVVSSRHGTGALPRLPRDLVPDGLLESEIMPPVETDGRACGLPSAYGNVSVFTPVRESGGRLVGELPRAGGRVVRFPLAPFMGMIGVASSAGPLSSVPPTLGGGNLDIRHLTAGSALYLPVAAEGALFFTGDPHMAQGHGEVALTAMEGSLRTTFRLTVCKPGSGAAPGVAFRYPFGETDDLWLPVGLSDPGDGGGVDLDVAMRRCVVNALDFLEEDLGMERAVAYAYLSAAADLEVSQVVDRTVGLHMAIRKAHFTG
jgi:acetamidase/formamidase